MKKNPIAYAGAFGCFYYSFLLWEYLSGRFDFYYTLLNVPVVLFTLLGALILIPWTLVSAALVSLRQRHFTAPLLSIFLLGVFGCLPSLIHTNLYLLGVRQRICSQMTPDQIRQAARAAALAGSEAGGFSRLGPVLSKNGPYGVVVVLGGCAVCGHTELRVQEPFITNRSEEVAYLSIAPDIEVFMKN